MPNVLRNFPQGRSLRKRSIRQFAPCIIVFSVLFGMPVIAQDTSETRMAAAQRYDAVSPFDDLLDKTLEKVKQSIPDEHRAEFMRLIKFVDRERLRQTYFEQLTKTFTTSELEALAEFYGSEDGQSILNKFPQFTADIMPMIQQEIQHAVTQMR